MKKILQIMLSLLFLCGFGYVCYIFAINVWAIFRTVDPSLLAGILTASATVIVSVITVMFSKKQEHKVEIEEQIRQRKVPIYERIIEFIFLITFAEKLGKDQPSDKEMIQFFADTTRDLVIWGSIDMVKAFGDFKEELASSSSDGDHKKIMSTVEDLLFAVRKDLAGC